MKVTLEKITKRFGAFEACRGIDLTINPGEVVVLLGENGAGKSTLMNILSGAMRPTSGQVRIDGELVDLADGHTARNFGIGMVHQHYELVGDLTVAQNIVLGNEGPEWILHNDKIAQRVLEVSERFGLEIDPHAKVSGLSVGAQQRVEIIKALSAGANLLILDEPTAVLTPDETDRLLKVMRDLANSGCSVVFITHKLREAREVADRIVVMRNGQIVGEEDSEASAAHLTKMMVGKTIEPALNNEQPSRGEIVLEMEGVSVNGHPGLHEVSLKVRAGEILGVGGVDGNGQAELEEAASGLISLREGRISVRGERIDGVPIRSVIERIRVIPSQRARWGMVAGATVTENFALRDFRVLPLGNKGWLNLSAMQEHAASLVSRFDVRYDRLTQKIGSLSGGNQQKVIVAREVANSTGVLIAAQPTRGIDVSAASFIHRTLIDLRAKGEAILLISADLEELLALSDRIMILYKGRIMGETDRDNRELIGSWMAGISPHLDGEAHE